MTVQVFIVTGGSRGIGAAIVERALQSGAAVAVCARVIEECATDTHLARCVDVGDPTQIRDFVRAAASHFGSVDVLVNNAAVVDAAPYLATSLRRWRNVMSVNAFGAYEASIAAVAECGRRDGGGVIINIGSVAHHGMALHAAYAASKGALWGITQALQRRYGKDGVRAHLLVPGLIETQMTARLTADVRQAVLGDTPLARGGMPHEVAAAVMHLASPAGAFLAGCMLHVSGGLRATQWPHAQPAKATRANGGGQ